MEWTLRESLWLLPMLDWRELSLSAWSLLGHEDVTKVERVWRADSQAVPRLPPAVGDYFRRISNIFLEVLP